MEKLITNKLLICINLVIALFIVAPAFGVGNVVGEGCVIFWTANTETDLAGYKLFFGTATGAYGPPQTILAPATSIKCADAGITTLGQYYATITAFDKAVPVNESVKAAEVPFVLADLIPPDAVTGLGVRDN